MAAGAISPFRIDIPDSALEDLKRRLQNTRWPDAEPVDDWSQGIPLAYVQEVAAFLRDEERASRAQEMVRKLLEEGARLGIGIDELERAFHAETGAEIRE